MSERRDEAGAATDRALLVLADIAGYTRFMKLHRLSLAHAQETTGRLLEAVVDAVPGLELRERSRVTRPFCTRARATTSRPTGGTPGRRPRCTAPFMPSSTASQRATAARATPAARPATCASSSSPTSERSPRQTIRRRTKLVGLDVILAHRMLKNDVPLPEYVLLSEALFESAPAEVRSRAEALEQELEGIGPARLWFVNVTGIAGELPPAPPATRLSQLGETAGVIVRGLPHLFRRGRRPRDEAPV